MKLDEDSFLKKSALLPENYEALLVFFVMMLIVSLGLPAFQTLFSSGLVESSPFSFEYTYTIEGEPTNIKVDCSPVRDTIIVASDAFECEYYALEDPVAMPGEDVPEYDLIEFYWKSAKSNRTVSQPIFNIDNLVGDDVLSLFKKVPTKNNTFRVQAPSNSGVYYANAVSADHNRTQWVFSQIAGNRSFVGSVEMDPQGQRVYTLSQVKEIKEGIVSDLVKIFVVLSTLFGGTSLILKLNSEKEVNSEREDNSRLISWFLIILASLVVSVQLWGLFYAYLFSFLIILIWLIVKLEVIGKAMKYIDNHL